MNLLEIPESSTGDLLAPLREELEHHLATAIAEAKKLPEYVIEHDEAERIFRGVAEHGDHRRAECRLNAVYDFSGGFSDEWDRLISHLETIGWAYWRLHRAEAKAFAERRPA